MNMFNVIKPLQILYFQNMLVHNVLFILLFNN